MGDIGHGEAKTAMIWSHLQETPADVACYTNVGNSIWTTPDVCFTFVTSESDCSGIMLLCEEASLDDITYMVGDATIDMRRARTTSRHHVLTPDYVVLLFALGGCDFSAATRGIGQYPFILCVLDWISNSSVDERIVPSRTSLPSVCDDIVLLTFLRGRSAKRKPAKKPRTVEWRREVRTILAGSAKRADEVVPESQDVELQWRRYLWVAGYWSSAKNCVCTNETIDGCDVSCGYDSDGEMILELPQDVRSRAQDIRSRRIPGPTNDASLHVEPGSDISEQNVSGIGTAKSIHYS